jgi:hypothetical protein
VGKRPQPIGISPMNKSTFLIERSEDDFKALQRRYKMRVFAVDTTGVLK